MNTPTLDTAAIRARFDGAVIGIREDGTMAVLVRGTSATFFDLVSGYRYSDLSLFCPVIRPGDECEVRSRPSIEWKRAKYFGFNAGYFSYFLASVSQGVASWEYIRPLPAPAVEQTVEQKAVEICRKLKQEMALFLRYRPYSDSIQPIIDLATEAAALFGEEGERG